MDCHRSQNRHRHRLENKPMPATVTIPSQNVNTVKATSRAISSADKPHAE